MVETRALRKDTTELPIFGTVAWCALALCWVVGIVDLTAVKLILAMALLIAVPLAIDLLHWETLRAESLRDASRRAMPVTAAIAAVALTRPTGVVAAALVVPWLANCAAVLLSGFLELLSARPLRIDRLALIVASGYLTFGAGWLIISRYGAQPLDFPDAIVELTAVHFHVAGFAAVIIACTAAAFAGRGVTRSLAIVGATGVVASMPVVALGITYSNDIAAVGSSMIGVSLACVAIAHARLAFRETLPRPVRALLAISALSVLAAMALAVQYTLGLAIGIPSLRIDQMAKTHGVLNGVGFVFSALLAWRIQTSAVDR